MHRHKHKSTINNNQDRMFPPEPRIIVGLEKYNITGTRQKIQFILLRVFSRTLKRMRMNPLMSSENTNKQWN